MLKFEAPKGPAQPSAAETRPACTAAVPRNALRDRFAKALEPFDHPRGLCSLSCEAEQGARPRLSQFCSFRCPT